MIDLPVVSNKSESESTSSAAFPLNLNFAKRKSRKVFIGNVPVGGGSPISVQTMTKTKTSDVDATVKQIVEERFAVPCFVLHDTNAIAVGEKHFGYGVGVSSFLTVWISDGVSLGAVINGEVHLGNDGFLGEFGHVHAVENGPLCYCGHSGCLETVTKESYIIEKVAAGLRSGVHSEISTLTGGDPRRMTIEEIKKAANDGDRFCKLIFEEVAGHIGAKLSDVINVLNPGLVTLRGSVIDDNPFLFENIYRIIHNRSVRFTSNSVQLNYGRCGEHIGIKGLGSWILSNYFLGH